KTASERIVSRRRLDRNPAQLRKRVDTRLAAEAPVSRRLHPAERHLRLIVHGGTVDVTDAALDLPCELQAFGDVASEDRRRETVLRIVRELHRLLGGLHARDRHLRTEGLLAE